ncbi:MAG: HEAT repeat domain-containing protein [Salinibacter sp.]
MSGVLWGLIIASLVLTAFSLVLGLTAVAAHFTSKNQKRTRQQNREQWRQALVDVIVGDASPQALSDQVEPSQRNQFLSFLVVYATTVRGQALERIREVARPLLSTAEKNLHARSRMVRAQAVRRIGLLGGRERAGVLDDALDDNSEFVALIAFRHLAEWSGPNDAPRLLNAVPHLSRADRVQLVSALVEVGEEAAPFFRKELRSGERSVFERVVCAETLRWLGDGDAAPVAVDLLKTSDPDPELTAALLRLLRRVGNPRHAPIVRRHCRADVPFVRIQATRALGQLGEDQDASLLADQVQNDPSRWVALSAAQSLAELGRTDQLRRLSESGDDRASIAADLLPARA